MCSSDVSVYPLRGLAEHPSDSASAAWPIDSSENWSPKNFPQHIFGFKTGRKAFQFPPLQGFMACGEALLVAILPRKQRIDGMPFGGISGDCGRVAHQPRFGLWRNAGCEGGLMVHRDRKSVG